MTIAAKREAHELSKRMQFPNGLFTWREWADAQATITVTECDGMIDYNRVHFNRLGSHHAQNAYLTRLRAKRYYWVNDTKTPKAVFLYAKRRLESSPAIAGTKR